MACLDYDPKWQFKAYDFIHSTLVQKEAIHLAKP